MGLMKRIRERARKGDGYGPLVEVTKSRGALNSHSDIL
jgi:hypothetical protein